MRKGYGRGGKRLTLVRFTDIIFFIQSGRLGGVINVKGDFHLSVQTQVAITEHVQDESKVTDLGRSLELHLESLHIESGLAVGVEEGLVEGGEGEGWDSHLALLGVGQEDVPPGRVVAGQVGSVSEGRLDGFDLLFDLDAVDELRGLVLGGFAAHDGVQVVFVGVNVFEVGGVNRWDVRAVARRDEAGLDDQLDETAGGDDLFAHDLEEGTGDFQDRELLGDGYGGGVLLLGHEASADSEAATLVFGDAHELLDGEVFLCVGTLNGLDNFLREVRELQERRRARRNSLDEMLGGPERTQDGSDVTECESNGCESFVQRQSDWCSFVLLCRYTNVSRSSRRIGCKFTYLR